VHHVDWVDFGHNRVVPLSAMHVHSVNIRIVQVLLHVSNVQLVQLTLSRLALNHVHCVHPVSLHQSLDYLSAMHVESVHMLNDQVAVYATHVQ
jgi:hypothetical protein